MQWIKDKVGGTSSGALEKQNFMIGSHKWTGSTHGNNPGSAPSTPVAPQGSFKNPEAAQNAVQAYDSGRAQPPNPYVQHTQAKIDKAASSKRIDKSASSKRSQVEEKTSKQPSGIYPNIFESSEQRSAAAAAAGVDPQNGGGSDEEEEEEVLTGTQVLVTIPGAIVHLIDEEESVHLATGDFSLVRLIQERTKVVVIAKVGKDLQWPLVQEEPVVKLDPTHYFFNLTVPMDDTESLSGKSVEEKSYSESDGTKVDTLNYGVTFPAESATAEEQTAKIRELDYFLERYSMFTAPTIVQGEAVKDADKQAEVVRNLPPQDPNFPGTVVPEETVSGQGKVVPSEETSQAFWTTMAPNVDDYNHTMSKGIAIGAGQVIRGIFWLSESTVQKLDSGNIYMQSKFSKKEKPTKISAITMGGVRSARKLTQMTDMVTAGVLGGLVYTTGLMSTAVVKSPAGKIFFKLLPGEVALVSLDAFNKVFDAIEKAGRDVMTTSNSVTQEFVNHRYGEEAKELTDESLRTVGHVAAVAWTVTKIRKALNPNKLKLSKTGIAKSVAKQALSKK